MMNLRQSLMGLFLAALTLALLGFSGALIYGAVQQGVASRAQVVASAESAQAVDVVIVTSTQIVPELLVFGQIRAARMLDLRPGVGGTVATVDVAFVEGGAVAAGQVLLRLDPFDAEDALARVRADVLDAEAERRDADRALALALDELAAAQAQAGLREQASERQRDLMARGVGAAQAVETAELARSAADQAVLARRQAIAQAETRLDQTDTALARLAISRAAAERALLETVITAKFAGILSDVVATAGGRVAANERVARLIDPNMLEVSFRVSTAQYANLLGPDGGLLPAEVRVELESSDGAIKAKGRISREGAAVGEGQTGRLIFAKLTNATSLRPGDFVTVRVDEPVLQGVSLLPATAVSADGDVLALGDDNRLDLVAVDVLRKQGNSVIIRAASLAERAVVAVRSPSLGAGILVQQNDAFAEMVTLSDVQRARLVEIVQTDPVFEPALKARFLAQLAQDRVPATVIATLEAGRGG